MEQQAKANERRLGDIEQPGAADDEFRAVFRASPDILLLLTPDFHMVDASDARLRATGTKREDIVGRPLFEIFPDNPNNEDAAGQANLRASLERVLATKQADEMGLQRYDLARTDGTFDERYWRPLNTPILGVDGEVRFILHRVEDATHEMRLGTSQATLQGVLDSSVSGIAVLEPIYDAQRQIVNFRIILVNPAGEKIVGKKNSVLQGTTLLENWPGHREAGLFDMYVRVAEAGAPAEMELQYDKEGYDLWLHVSVVKVGTGVAATFTDITEHKRAEARDAASVEKLRQADLMKDQFLGILSHELRTPINAIMGFSSVLADGVAGELSPDQFKYVGKILDCSDGLLGLVNDLLDMSRVQAGKFSLELQAVEVAPLMRNVMASLSPAAVKKGHSLINRVPADLPLLTADPQRLSQVVSNLISNAIKYTPDGGTITVTAKSERHCLRVAVSDTGLGVESGQQARIFDAFTQVDMSNTRATGGVGLGLSIVKGLVEAHGGEVGVESQGVGAGSTFWFTLPRAP